MKHYKKNNPLRIEALQAMDLLAGYCNNEDIIDFWLRAGIADGDAIKSEWLEAYTDDETFSEIMQAFLECMHYAFKDGGLFIYHVLSESAALDSAEDDEEIQIEEVDSLVGYDPIEDIKKLSIFGGENK